MTLPNFFIIGAARAGTTSLYQYLKQHPQIYMSPVKEPGFFDYMGRDKTVLDPASRYVRSSKYYRCIRRVIEYSHTQVNDMHSYERLFRGVTGELAVGEASTRYLSSPVAPSRIYDFIPGAKMIVVLRNPVDRAYSEFALFRSIGWEPLNDLQEAFGEEDVRIQDRVMLPDNYKRGGFYYTHLKRYLDKFGKGQVRWYLYEDFTDDPVEIIKDIFGFLSVDNAFVPDISVRYNSSASVLNRTIRDVGRGVRYKTYGFREVIQSVWAWSIWESMGRELMNGIGISRPRRVEQHEREALLEEFYDEILNLENLLDTDLSNWLN